ncbi:MAG: hypothetical protein RLZ97_2702 [Verrucomicrobiota bacterium]
MSGESFFTAGESFFAAGESFLAAGESFFAAGESLFAAGESFFAFGESFLAFRESFLASRESLFVAGESFLASRESSFVAGESSFAFRDASDHGSAQTTLGMIRISPLRGVAALGFEVEMDAVLGEHNGGLSIPPRLPSFKSAQMSITYPPPLLTASASSMWIQRIV